MPRLFIPGMLCVLVVTMCSCQTWMPGPHRKHAFEFSDATVANRMSHVGQVTEHEIDIRNGGFIVLQPNLEALWEGIARSASTDTVVANTALLGLVVGAPINLRIHQSYGRLWKPDNRLRKRLLEEYGTKLDEAFLNKKNVLYYQWLDDTRPNYSLIPASPKNMWLFIGPQHLGESDINHITKRDLEAFVKRLESHRYWMIKVKFHGSVKLPPPPFMWGYASIFELLRMEPAVSKHAVQTESR